MDIRLVYGTSESKKGQNTSLSQSVPIVGIVYDCKNNLTEVEDF